MTIDEAIAHAREVADRNRNFDVIPEKVMATSTFKYNCLKCAEEHEQLAEWLEELKKYREIGLTQYMIKGIIKSEMQAHEDAVHNAELLDEYEEIGTIEERREAVEKQKEMITYCDENDCADCPYSRGNMKENRCMNDFIAEKISKGVCNACIDAIGGGDN